MTALNNDLRVQQALDILAEVARDQKKLTPEQAVWGGLSSSETRRQDFDFEFKIVPKAKDRQAEEKAALAKIKAARGEK